MTEGLGEPGRRTASLLIAAVAALGSAIASIAVGLSAYASDGLEGVFAPFIGAYGAVLYTFVGVVVLWRRPGHGIGRVALTIGLVFTAGVLLSTVRLASPLLEASLALSEGLTLVGWIVGGSLLVVRFPSGRRTSRLGAVVEAVLVVAMTSLILASATSDLEGDPSPGLEVVLSIASTVGFGGVLVVYLGALLDLGLRYRLADAIGRTQMRWVLAAEAVSVALAIALAVFGDVFDQLWALWLMSMGLPVLAVAVALTRYHLYDIDRIISRSISYVIITGVLFAAFAATTLTLQRLLTGAFSAGRELDPWVVAASTLLAAALFNPVRSRVQAAVDRRFHRERYDTSRIVAGFSARLRDQLDLQTVSGELASTATHALEPSTTAVWLRPRA